VGKGTKYLPMHSGISIRNTMEILSEDFLITIYEIIKIIRKEILPGYL
jgi:hypothetical protein